MAVITLDQIVQFVDELPALPDVTVRVMQMANDPSTSGRDIANTVAKDMSLTARVLRIANSAYYGVPRTVSTVSQALTILGMQALRNLCLAAGAYDTLSRECMGYGLRAGDLWQHSLATAQAAQVVAARTQAARAEEAFVCGMLHDIGKVVLNVHVAAQSDAILALAELEQIPFHEAERHLLGFDHAEVGGRVAEQWKLPKSVCEAISGHHEIERAGTWVRLAAVVHVANAISHAARAGFGVDAPRPAASRAACSLLALRGEDLDALVEEAAAQISRTQSVFAFDKAA